MSDLVAEATVTLVSAHGIEWDEPVAVYESELPDDGDSPTVEDVAERKAVTRYRGRSFVDPVDVKID